MNALCANASPWQMQPASRRSPWIDCKAFTWINGLILIVLTAILIAGCAFCGAQTIDRAMFTTLSPNDPPEVKAVSGFEAFRKGKTLAAEDKYTKALFWYERAVAKGNVDAPAEIGVFYCHALGVPKDMSMAAKWYKVAVEHKSALGALRLAGLYQHGKGVPNDHAQAVTLLKESCELGNSEAAFHLAATYRSGMVSGVPAQPALAQMYSQRARAQIQSANLICGDPSVRSAMQESMFEGVKKAYFSETGMVALSVVAAMNSSVSPPLATKEAHRLTSVLATLSLGNDSAECEANFASDPTNWAYQVYRVPVIEGKGYLVVNATGSQWVQLMGVKASIMMSGDGAPAGINNLHDYDPN